jgi:hypothetical protein
MKVPIQAPVTAEQLRQILSQALPQYTYTLRTKNLLVVQKSAGVGANVVPGKKKINVVGTFPNMGAMMLFVLCVVFLGVLLPLLVYFIGWYGRQRAVEKEVGAALETALAGYGVQPPMQGSQGSWQPTA